MSESRFIPHFSHVESESSQVILGQSLESFTNQDSSHPNTDIGRYKCATLYATSIVIITTIYISTYVLDNTDIRAHISRTNNFSCIFSVTYTFFLSLYLHYKCQFSVRTPTSRHCVLIRPRGSSSSPGPNWIFTCATN